MVEVIPAILTSSSLELREMVAKAEGLAERIQIDIVDGKFANNKTIDPSILVDVETNLKLDFHLMVKEPASWVEKCAGARADRIIAQIEYMGNQIDFVGKVQEVGVSAGFAIDIDTDISRIDVTILNNLDVVLIMSVPAGFGGQKFDRAALNKIKRLDEIRVRDKIPFRICADGGITRENIASLRKAGVDEIAIGKRLFGGDIRDNLESFRKAAYK